VDEESIDEILNYERQWVLPWKKGKENADEIKH